ncbi:MAG: hypothetical protein ACYC18_09280 [Gammaproteobacteria bacterium]
MSTAPDWVPPAPRLRLPEQRPSAGDGPDLRRPALESWLHDLPMADPEQAGDRLLETLRDFNRTRMPERQRAEALALFRIPVAQAMDALIARYAQAPLPLRERYRRCAERVHELAVEAAYAEKALVLQAAADGLVDSRARARYRAALVDGVRALGRVLLEHYRVYAPEPQGIWAELHELYRHAEHLSACGSPETPVADDPSSPLGPVHEYQRVVLLALANPYHLMQGEVQTLYDALHGWAAQARLYVPDDGNLLGRFFITLDTDLPPGFGFAQHRRSAAALRVVEHAAVLREVSKRIAAFSDPGKGGQVPTPLSLAQRLERGMLFRLKRAWSARVPRQHSRTPRASPVRLAVGISACHHFLCAESAFCPERDEVRMRGGNAAVRVHALSLVPKEVEPWRIQDAEQRLTSGIATPRQSHFDPEDLQRDVWEKIYARAMDAGAGPMRFQCCTWNRHDVSAGGMSVRGIAPAGIEVRVGELVAFGESDSRPGTWALGVIRWLKVHPDSHMEAGIKALAERAAPVATRGVAGTGEGTEYFRALGVPRPGQDAMDTLIVPAAVYDLGTVVAINLGNKLLYVRLTKLAETTRAFSQFEYRGVAAPASERNFMPAIPHGH